MILRCVSRKTKAACLKPPHYLKRYNPPNTVLDVISDHDGIESSAIYHQKALPPLFQAVYCRAFNSVMVRNDAQNSVGGVVSFQIVWGFYNERKCFLSFNHKAPTQIQTTLPQKPFWTPFWTTTELKARQCTVEKPWSPSFKWYIAELSTHSWSKMALQSILRAISRSIGGGALLYKYSVSTSNYSVDTLVASSVQL